MSERPTPMIGDWEPMQEELAHLGYRLGDLDETQPAPQLLAQVFAMIAQSREIRMRKQETNPGRQ
jgi:hypothetical protein